MLAKLSVFAVSIHARYDLLASAASAMPFFGTYVVLFHYFGSHDDDL